MRALQTQLTIIVEANPHNAEQLGSKSREPSVMRCSGLARSRQLETHRADTGRGPAAHHFLEHVDHEERNSRIQYAPCFGRMPVQRRAVWIDHTRDERRPLTNPAIGKYRVSSGDFQR